MKILHVINALTSGGAEKLMLDLLPRLNAMGHEADLLIFSETGNVYLDQIREKNVKVISFGESKVYDVRHVFRLRAVLHNYDVIHVHLFPAQLWVRLAIAGISRKKLLITTEHNSANNRRKYAAFRWLDKWMYNAYQKVVCVSRDTCNQLVDWINVACSDKFVVIDNGIDLNAVEQAQPLQRASLNLNEHDVILLSVARLNAQKDHITLINVLQFLPENVHLLIVGEGELEQDLKVQVQMLKLDNRVHFLGYRRDVYELYKTADLNILSSHYEGLSLSSIEAMASGTPFIASEVPGLRDLVKGYGVLFEEGSVTDLKEKIITIIEDKAWYEKVSKACVQRARHYDINRMVTEYVSLYKY